MSSGYKLAFSRFTQIGLLRLLANPAVMHTEARTLQDAWRIYDRWLQDESVDFYAEPSNLEAAFRRAAQPAVRLRATKAIADWYQLAYASELGATLVPFDQALHAFARQHGYASLIPSTGP